MHGNIQFHNSVDTPYRNLQANKIQRKKYHHALPLQLDKR